MKKFFNIFPFVLAGIALLFTACEEEERTFPEFGEIETGAFARLITSDFAPQFDFLDIDGSEVNFEVEFYDVNQGRDVASYDWSVNYGGQGPIAIKSYPASTYETNADGLPQVNVVITFREVLDALGLDQNGIIPGEAFDLQGTIVMNDGRTFTSANSNGALQGQPTFLSVFAVRTGVINVPCFSKLSGTYDASITVTNQMAGIDWDGCGGSGYSTRVTFIAEHDEDEFNTGVYLIRSEDENGIFQIDASMGGFYGCYTGTRTDPGGLPTGGEVDDGMLRLNDDCGSLFWTGASQWGEIYSIASVMVSGADLTIAWTNDYGEGASVKLTRTDGTEWPTDLKDGD